MPTTREGSLYSTFWTFISNVILTNQKFARVPITEISKHRSSLVYILVMIIITSVSTYSKVDNNQGGLEKTLFGEGTFSILAIRTHFLRERLQDGGECVPSSQYDVMLSNIARPSQSPVHVV